MSEDKLVTIRRCGPVWEAEMLRDRLEAAGIRAFVQGAETNRSLSYVGVALGGVKVQVAASEVAAAEQVLSDDERQRTTAGNWQCPRCDEINEPAFDVCWKCSMPRAEALESQPDSLERSDPVDGPLDPPPETHNPYQPSGAYQSADGYRPAGSGDRYDNSEQREGLGVVRLGMLLILAAVILYLIVTLAGVILPN